MVRIKTIHSGIMCIYEAGYVMEGDIFEITSI